MADPVGPLEIERNAAEEIGQGRLHGKADDDGEHARGCEHARERLVECRRHDAEHRHDQHEGAHHVFQQFGRTHLAACEEAPNETLEQDEREQREDDPPHDAEQAPGIAEQALHDGRFKPGGQQRQPEPGPGCGQQGHADQRQATMGGIRRAQARNREPDGGNRNDRGIDPVMGGRLRHPVPTLARNRTTALQSRHKTKTSGENDMRLAGKIAIVTGAGSGFGEGIAQRFAAEGAAVAVVDLNAEAAARVAKAIADAGGNSLALAADVASRTDTERMVDKTLAAFGRLDIVVNNAGISHVNGPMLSVDEATFDRVFVVNVKSIYLAAQVCVPVFRRQGGGGVFLNTASTAGLRPRPGLTWYNGSKGAAITLTKSMAVELAPEKIRVNCLCPVAGETPLLATFMGQDTPEKRAQFKASIPLGRLSTPTDIANAALYLCSDEAEFITGVAFEVDGGRCI